jgi:hypothetical protein
MTRITCTLQENVTFLIISRWIILRMWNFPDKICNENRDTHFMFNQTFPKMCCLWDDVEKCGTFKQGTDNIILRIHFDRRIIKATDTYSKCVILIAFPRQQRLRERAPQCCFIHTLPVLEFLLFGTIPSIAAEMNQHDDQLSCWSITYTLLVFR